MIVVVPVPSDAIGANLATIMEREGSLARIVRNHHFNRPVYEDVLRVGLVKNAFHFLTDKLVNPYTLRDNHLVEDRRQQLEAFQDDRSVPDIIQDAQASFTEDVGDTDQSFVLNEDAAERNRTSLRYVASVFLPDGSFAPGSEHVPVR